MRISSLSGILLLVFCLIAFLVIPWLGTRYFLFLATLVCINAIGAQGLNFLIGYTGQFSLGHGAFVALGAYFTAIMCNTYHLSFWLAFVLAPILTGLVGILIGLPTLRLKGLYLAMITLAFAMVVGLGLMTLDTITGGYQGINVPNPRLGPMIFNTELHFYYLALLTAVLFYWASINLARTKIYRAFMAIREKEISAQSMGISLWYYKTLAFVLSSVYAGMAGCLFSVTMGNITPNNFPLMYSIEFVIMNIVGGTGSIFGIIFGATLITILPYTLLYLVQALSPIYPSLVVLFADIKIIIYGLVIILFLTYAPGGFEGLRLKIFVYLRKLSLKRG
jgi:branched-chain amino acid transport system permease protein